ncbi:MAG: LysR family transcriptional regulator [Pseudomonadota bacterium]
MRPNHHQFVAFAYVVREGSFSAAANELGVTQSTITQHVAKLEQNVGAQLLWRRRDGVEVTPTGQALYDLADRLVAVETAIGERLEGFASMKEGRIKVIANAPQPALGIIRRFHEAFPTIHIDFGLHDWTTATTMIRDRLADVGLITDPPQNEEWDRHRLMKTRYVAYQSALQKRISEPVTSLAELASHSLILPEKGSLTQRVVQSKLREIGIKPPRIVNMTTFPLMCEAVLQGIGVAIFLRQSSLIKDGISEVEVADLDQIHETWLVAPKDKAKLRLISEFTSIAVTEDWGGI